MATVFDVAKYILSKYEHLSTWKLQKLCYYSQAWTLAWNDRELFPEEFEAWANGPVCRALYGYHRGSFVLDAKSIPIGDSDNLTDEDKENIDIVLAHYGGKDPYWLREQSHSEDPWKNARKGYAEGAECDVVISRASMGEYYGSL